MIAIFRKMNFPFPEDSIESKRASLLLVMSLLAFLVMAVDLVSEIMGGYVVHAVLEGATLVFIALNGLYFLRTHQLVFSSVVLVGLISFMSIASLQIDGFGKESALFWTAALPLPIFIQIGTRKGVYLSILNLSAIIGIMVGALLEWYVPLFEIELLFQVALGYLAITILIYYFEKIRSDYETRLVYLAKERETLLREVNHRVKNNMQIIISMLRLQADRSDDEVKSVVKIAENRIRSMLFTHELLYKGDNVASIEPKVYIKALVRAISESCHFDDAAIKAYIGADVELTMDTLVEVGFIVNELLTNAIKYAHNAQGIRITVTLRKLENGHMLEVKDNGEVVHEPIVEGLGGVFVRSIVTYQLKGEMQISKNSGWSTRIRF